MRGKNRELMKRVLAFLMAGILLVSGIPDIGTIMPVYAEEDTESKTLEVSLGVSSVVYTGGNWMPAVKVSVFYGRENVTEKATVTWKKKGSDEKQTELVDAGSYTCFVSYQDENSETGTVFSGSAEFTIYEKALTDNMVGNIPEQVYDRKAKRPVTVTDPDRNKVLTENTDYLVEYTDNVNAVEEVTATIRGIGNYTGTVVRKFKIVPKPVTDSDVSLEKTTGVYTGKAQNIVIKADFSSYKRTFYRGEEIEENKVEKIIDAGNYKVCIESTDSNYKGKVSLDYSVTAKSIVSKDIVITFSKETPIIYNGKKQKPEVEAVKDGERVLKENTDYEVNYGDGNFTDRGEYPIVISGKGNYQGEARKIFKIQTGTPTINEKDIVIEGKGYQEGYYRSSVSVKIAGYKISDKEDGEYFDTLSYSTSGVKEPKIYLKENKSGEIYGPVTLKAFTIISEKPSASVTISPDAEKWTKEKTIKISNPKQDVAYYYAKEFRQLSEVNSDSDLVDLTRINDDSLPVRQEVDDKAIVYYIYAVDKAGNVNTSQVNVKKIDRTKPEISVNKINSHYDGQVFWKNGKSPLTIQIAVSDDRAGVKSVQASPEKGVTVSADKSSVTFENAGNYTLTVVDQAGNSSSCEVEIRQDDVVPTISVHEPKVDKEENKLNVYYDGDICWINQDSMRLPFEITDHEDENGQHSAIQAEYRVDGGVWTKLSAEEMKEQFKVFENINEDAKQYVFRVSDLAGNVSEEAGIIIVGDLKKPVVTNVNFEQICDSEWINKESIGENAKIKLCVSATEEENSSGISKISYIFSQDPDKKSEDYKDSDFQEAQRVEIDSERNTYSFYTKESFGSEEYPDGTYYWIIRVTDYVGNYADYSAITQVDTTLPEEKAYARFISDAEGVNADEMIKTEDSWTGKIYSFLSDKWNQICGKKRVKFELYLKDTTSGIDNAVLHYQADGTEKVLSVEEGQLSVIDGLKAFEEGGYATTDVTDPAEGYTVITGNITINEEEDLAVSNFVLVSVKDKAGNVREDYVLNEGKHMVYLDAVMPELTAVTVDGVSVLENEIFYYAEEKRVRLEINERFFAEAVENNAAPVFSVLSRTSKKNAFEVDQQLTDCANKQEWVMTEDVTKTDNGEYRNYVEISLPLEEEREVEYQFTVSFQDPSGNLMTNGKNVSGVSNGVYTSPIFAISSRKPVFNHYSITGTTDRQVDGVDVYHMGENGAEDVTLAFTIEDNDEYWMKENLTLAIYNQSLDKDAPMQTLKGDQLEWEVDGNSHRASYAFSGEQEPAKYRIEVTFKNKFGNEMLYTDGEGEVHSRFDSPEFILDHEAPSYSVHYNQAYRLVKDGVGNTGAENDKMNCMPETGYTAYYKDDIEVSFEIEEDFAIFSESGKLNSDFMCVITKDGVEMEELPGITWKKQESRYMGNFVLREEGSYEIRMEYRDAAGNKMTAGSGVIGSKTDTLVSADGVYSSTVLVLDRTKPEITTAYVDENGETVLPSAEIGERKYFNQQVYLQVTVDDRNIRYGEFKNALLNTEGSLRVYDVLENSITDDSVTAFLNRPDFKVDTVSHEGVTWRIPLYSLTDEEYGANYDITLRYEDLAGNGIKNTPEDNAVTVYPTFDDRMSQSDAYICFNSDVLGSNSQSAELMDHSNHGWMSKIIGFVHNKWLKIFGKEKIEFKIYLRDRISGVDSVEMGYCGDKKEDISFGTEDSGRAEVTLKISATEQERKDNDVYAGYMVLEGEMTVPEGQDVSVEQFRIVKTEDIAGNARSTDDTGADFVLHNIDAETDLLYLDRVAPVLDIDYTENGVLDEENGEQRIFYKDAATLTYRLTERFFAANRDNGKNDGSPIEPEVNISGPNKEEAIVSGWEIVENEDYHASASICFPTVSNGETEYHYTIAYQDGAENLLTAGASCKGTATEGVYTDYTIILDNQAPRLTAFEIQGDTDRQVNGVSVYHNNGDSEEKDATIVFTVDDNAAYWNPKDLVFEIYSDSQESGDPCVQLKGNELEWVDEGRNHSTAYKFDGENEVPAGYYVKISYADRAGNHMVSGSASVDPSQFSNGVYTSTGFAFDHVAPIFNISYSNAYRVVNDKLSVIKDSDSKVPQTGYTSYYNDRIDVEFTVTDHYLVAQDGQITNQPGNDIVLSIIKDGKKLEEDEMPEVSWSENKNKEGVPVYRAQFQLQRDGRYQISVFGRDAAMNKMIAGGNVQGSSDTVSITEEMDYGVYTSTLLVLDTHAPVVKFTYVDPSTKKEVNPQNIFESTKRRYFAQSVYLQISIDDTLEGIPDSGNIRYQELKKALRLISVNADGKTLHSTKAQTAMDAINAAQTAKREFVIELPMSDEANYDLLVEGFEDLAGNKAESMVTKACVDCTQPEATLSYELSKKSGFVEALKYGKKDIWFADSTLLVTANVKDVTAGVREIVFTVKDTDGDGKTLYRTKTINPPDTISWENEQTFMVPIPLETADFDGTITARVTDWSNKTYEVGHASVIESKKTHNKTNEVEIITKTQPSRVVGGVDFYNTDVDFTFSMKDSYSGIRNYAIRPGQDTIVKRDFNEGKTNGIRYEYKKTVTLSSRKNNKNAVDVIAEYTDNTNHTASVKQQYNIDITAPIIEVEYNLNNPSSERYYKETRVATVTIMERNFDEKDVEFTITNSEGTQPAISGWSHSGNGDSTRNTCTITYSADGDYTFSVAYQDKAGNKASYHRVDEFTIDQTVPTYTVSYDNNENENGYYYKKERTATIDISEHNFDPEGIQVEVKKNGVSVSAQLSGWSTNGDHNIATVPFKEDGDYTFMISGMDKAQNELEPYPGDHFVIDRTAPDLAIQNIEDMSANNDVVAPRIVYNDTNYDAARTSIIYEGYHNGKVDYSQYGTTTTSAQGAVIQMNDVERVQEKDDIYTMKVIVYDKAGNMSEAEKIFSVNRFGSVYTFEDAKTKALVGNGLSYTNLAQDIKIKETNVDTLEFKEITCNHDGELLPMEEGAQYDVDVSGSETTWKQYKYTLHKDNFEADGRYTIKILSEDRATNISDNDTKGKKVEFVMDTVAPSALVSGVEDNGRYQTNNQDVAVDVEDNVLLHRVQMFVNDQLVADYDDVKELSERNGILSCSIPEQNYAQSFMVIATDAAGNEYVAEVKNITVNTSWWRLFLANKPLFYGSIAAGVLLLAFLWLLILAKKKKKEEEVA